MPRGLGNTYLPPGAIPCNCPSTGNPFDFDFPNLPQLTINTANSKKEVELNRRLFIFIYNVVRYIDKYILILITIN
jgi:hypothetical protein